MSNLEITESSHPKHPLLHVNCPQIFTCDGCKEYGAGERFQCNQNCDFHLHDFCALSPSLLQQHPLHAQHELVFHSKPGFLSSRRCHVCAKATKGYSYRCSKCRFKMHPCCSKLSQEMDLPVHKHTLSLLPAKRASDNKKLVCGECNGRRGGRVYSCTDCDYYLHAFCAKGMMNGLYANGVEAPEKRGIKEVFNAFLEGIMEGITKRLGK